MTTIRSPQNPRVRIPLTPEVVRGLVATARTAPAYSASWHVQAMADALEVLAASANDVSITDAELDEMDAHSRRPCPDDGVWDELAAETIVYARRLLAEVRRTRAPWSKP